LRPAAPRSPSRSVQSVSPTSLENAAFRITPDLRFLFACESHDKAFAALHGGIEAGKRLCLVTGGFGLGKTLLLRRLQAALTRSAIPSTYGGLPDIDLLNALTLRSADANAPGTRHVLLVDDADRSSDDLLRSLETQLSAPQQASHSLQFVLAGGLEFDAILAANFPALHRSVEIEARIEPLSGPETAGYIRHRLIVSGFRDIAIAEDAIARIVAYAGGIPRLINHICARALLIAGPRRLISPEIVAEAIDDYRATVSFGSGPAPAFFRGAPLGEAASLVSTASEASSNQSNSEPETGLLPENTPPDASGRLSAQKNNDPSTPPLQDASTPVHAEIEPRLPAATIGDDRPSAISVDKDVCIPPLPAGGPARLSGRERLRRRYRQAEQLPAVLRHSSDHGEHKRAGAARPEFSGFRPRRAAIDTPPETEAVEGGRTRPQRGRNAIAFWLALFTIAAIPAVAIWQDSEIQLTAIAHGSASMAALDDAWQALTADVSALFESFREFVGRQTGS
jgi:type II secretory pathway predicted ATPase ExeA